MGTSGDAKSGSRTTQRQGTLDRQRQIVDQAAELFDQSGFHSTSMDDLAVAVGIRKATIYYHFRSKDEILLRIQREFLDALFARCESRSNFELTATEALFEIMADMLEVIDSHHAHVRSFFEYHRELAEDTRMLIAEDRDRYRSLVEDTIRRGVRDGEFCISDARVTALGIFGMCNWAYQWYSKDGHMDPREIARIFWSIIIEGLETNKPTDKA